ncbi:MAG TPA: VOC family protein [Acidimicrobiia bacterium]|nr:VOC family protein [Acidimicrobiia bacterium]
MSEVTEYAPGTPSWVDLATTDADAACAFYTALFGWRGEDQGEQAGHYVMLRKGDRDVAALYQAGPGQGPPHWNTYVTVAEVAHSVEKIESLGGTVAMPPFDVMDAGRMAVVQDATGGMVSLWEPRRQIGSGLVNEPGTLCWYELITSDRERAATFYGGLFGWSSRTHQMGAMAYTEFLNGDRPVAGMMEMQGIPSHWEVYFAVEDTDAALARATQLGGFVVRPPMEILFGRMAAVSDPQGAVFSVMTLAARSG